MMPRFKLAMPTLALNCTQKASSIELWRVIKEMLMWMSSTMCSMKGFHSFHDHSSSKKEYHPKEPIIIGHSESIHSLRWALYTTLSTTTDPSKKEYHPK